MDRKTFFIFGLILIVAVSVITSLIAVSLMKKQVLPAPYGTGGEGQIQITGLESAVVNVIIIDDSIITAVTDLVSFTNVNR